MLGHHHLAPQFPRLQLRLVRLRLRQPRPLGFIVVNNPVAADPYPAQVTPLQPLPILPRRITPRTLRRRISRPPNRLQPIDRDLRKLGRLGLR